MTTWNPVTRPWPSNYTTRPWITFIATEALDFLMTESDDYIVTNDSIVTNWSWRNIP